MRYVAVLKPDNDIIIRGDICCVSLQDLYRALVNTNTTEIIITKEFANEFFTYSALNDFITYSASVASNVSIVVDDVISLSNLKAVIDLKSITLPDELIYALEVNPTRVISTIQMLCNNFLEEHDDAAIANNRIASMRVRLEDLRSQLRSAEAENRKLQDECNDIKSRLHALVSRTNFRYEKTVEPDSLFVADSNGYNHILYVKEITRVHYMDTLLYYLSEILKTLYEVPVRTVVIEPYYSYGRECLYPNMRPHWQLKYRDVYSGNIMMAGYQPHLMEDILKNPSHVNYLVILDRGGYQIPHVQCGNTTYIYTASDISDVSDAIDRNQIISYDESTLYIPYIEDFNKLSPESKVQKYSSMNVTKELINYLEEVSK